MAKGGDDMIRVEEMSADEYGRSWPELSGYDSKTLFHDPGWLRYLEQTGKGRARFLRLVESTATVGIHVFLETRVGPLRIMGSPLPGWTTNYMGPLFNRDADQRLVLRAIKSFAQRHGYLYVELKNRSLERQLVEGQGFTARADTTSVVVLDDDTEALWKRLSSNARNRIRKAEASDLVVETAPDRGVVADYFAMIVARYAAQGLTFPFGIDRLYALFDCLAPEGKLITLRIAKGGETICAGLFPYDRGSIYYFGGASKESFNALCPNELMHWTIIKLAVDSGIAEYDLCGTSRFKRKFGTQEIPFVSYGYSPVPGMMGVRNALAALHWKRLAWSHALRRKLGGEPPAANEE